MIQGSGFKVERLASGEIEVSFTYGATVEGGGLKVTNTCDTVLTYGKGDPYGENLLRSLEKGARGAEERARKALDERLAEGKQGAGQ